MNYETLFFVPILALWSSILGNDWNNAVSSESGGDDIFAKSSRCGTSRRNAQLWNL